MASNADKPPTPPPCPADPAARPAARAPKGNRNALRHGRYTAEAIAMRREMGALLRRSHELIESIWPRDRIAL